ncbi:SGNH/GDSL hydrolase family protein [Oscillatoria salina]|uniref:SGNH/GDSL hydrolase family protein n=1 Tax=Oscillatoria salina TaxID=331517 RepID=UPI001CCF803F|nr:SGNH/GDSL hydrolase family protein [Oscillatoria salina]
MRITLKRYPRWAVWSLATNGLLILAIAFVVVRQQIWSKRSWASSSLPSVKLEMPTAIPSPELGERHQLNYQQWVALLATEAEVAAKNQPENLHILLGDSISLWFPPELLPENKTWLNQGISGETSLGLLRRLELIDKTEPEFIFVMIGINDLLKGIPDHTVVANQRLIVRYLQRVHPEAKIIIQSVLPHSAEKATWEGKDRLLEIPNDRIQKINHRLEAIAREQNIIYLDLYSLFADTQGNLRTELSTDGLHLNHEGYKLWRTALLVTTQLSRSRIYQLSVEIGDKEEGETRRTRRTSKIN